MPFLAANSKLTARAGLALVLAAALVAGGSDALAQTTIVQLRNARPEDVERVLTRLLPDLGVAALPAQSAVLLNGPSGRLAEAARIIRSIDVPSRFVELEVSIGRASAALARTTALGLGVRRARAPGGGPPAPPTVLREVTGGSSGQSRQSIVVTAGTSAEVVFGETALADLGPFQAPVEVRTGKRVVVDDVRVLGTDEGVELSVAVEDTAPGPVPLSSSGLGVRTRLRLKPGEIRTVATHDEQSEDSTGGLEGAADDDGARGSFSRNRVMDSESAVVTVTLRAIR